MTQNNFSAEDLGEEEQSFYSSIRKNLNAIVLTPGRDLIAGILNYSKSL